MTIPLPALDGTDDTLQFILDQIAMAFPPAFPETKHTIGTAGQPAFANAWVNFGATSLAAYYKDRGRVYLTGLIKSGVVGSPAFTLPTGYRPADAVRITAVSNGAFGHITVGSSGDMTPVVGSNVYFDLSGISFAV